MSSSRVKVAVEKATRAIERAPMAEGLAEPRPKRTITGAEVRARELLVESLWIQGTSREQIVKVAAVQIPGFRRNAVLTVLDRVKERVVAEGEADRRAWKTQQIRRLYGQIQRLRTMAQTALARDPPDVRAAADVERTIVGSEKLLADIQGNREPLQVSVEVSMQAAVAMVVAELTPDQIQAYSDEYSEVVEKAALYEASYPEPELVRR